MAVRTRRTQEERVEETRAALMDATIAVLVEVGYAATTTREVALRAEVSRGAQTHHFPTKAELVAASIEHLFAQQAERFRAGFAAVPPDERDLGTAVGLLWEIITGPTYPAVLELTVAARTDETLRVIVHALSAALEATVTELVVAFFPDLGTDERVAQTLIDIGFTIVQGAALSSYAGFGDPERTIRLTRSVAALITADSARLVAGAIDAFDRPHPTPRSNP